MSVVGSGSNLLIADEGVRGPRASSSTASWRAIEVDGRRIVCGGGARLPAVAARAARAGLSGIEFGVNIPGTVGGAVRMNANAYGGELERVLEWVEIATAAGVERRAPAAARLRLPPLRPRARARSSRAPACCCAAAEPEAVRATLADMRARRHEAQPQGIKTFGSTFKNPEDPRAEGASAGLLLARGGLQRPGGGRRALRAQARQLHREHRDGQHGGRRRA